MNLSKFIKESLSGNLESFLFLMEIEHDELLKASKEIKLLIVTRSSVLKVLKKLKEGNVSIEIVQKWASFIKRGYVDRNTFGPIRPIIIDYEIEYEDSIVEALSRLDELGDEVDGVVDKKELYSLISSLS